MIIILAPNAQTAIGPRHPLLYPGRNAKHHTLHDVVYRGTFVCQISCLAGDGQDLSSPNTVVCATRHVCYGRSERIRYGRYPCSSIPSIPYIPSSIQQSRSATQQAVVEWQVHLDLDFIPTSTPPEVPGSRVKAHRSQPCRTTHFETNLDITSRINLHNIYDHGHHLPHVPGTFAKPRQEIPPNSIQ